MPPLLASIQVHLENVNTLPISIAVSIFYSSCVVYFVFSNLVRHRARTSLPHIPSVGGSEFLASYRTAFKFMFDANSVIQSGYEKHKNRAFKLPYTLGEETLRNTHHLGFVENAMNKQLSQILPSIADETKKAFADNISARVTGTEWTPIRATDAVQNIVCRAVNRAFVGDVLCRNENYSNINMQFTRHVVFGAVFINFFPGPLKRIARPAFIQISGLRKRMARHLKPLIQARSKAPERKNDMLIWLMESASPEERYSADALALRILNVNFTFTHALLYLASKPEYLHPLRQELGRFLASAELKCTLSHVILEYDVKMAVEGVRPPDDWFGPMCTPSVNAEVLSPALVHGNEQSTFLIISLSRSVL
ncbi:hypothetical protein C8R43DRAFT_1134982 [Mycena crocata]|nr:hypothetical protein C8R43DRAFT_1134982 [Mycena crocata]